MIGLDSFLAQDTEFETSGYNLFVLGSFRLVSANNNHNSLPSLNMPFFNCGYYMEQAKFRKFNPKMVEDDDAPQWLLRVIDAWFWHPS